MGQNQINKKNPIETIADITWFSVKLDINIPNERYAKDNNENPKIVTKALSKWGVPTIDNIIKYIKVASVETNTTNPPAKNFPKTIEVTLLGDVNNNCSVPVFLSSENILIVNIGTIKVKTVAAEPNILENSVLWYANKSK